MRRRTLPIAFMLVAAAALPVGCASTGGTAAEDPVTFICSPQEDWCQLVAAKFTASSGIPANYVRLSAGEAVARLTATGDSPEFDAWFGASADAHLAAEENGLIDPYISENAATIPDKYKDADGRWTGIYVNALSFCSNRDVLDEIGQKAPESWADLLDPGFKGNLAIAHPGTSGTAYLALWTQVGLNGGDADAAIDYFTRLHSNVLQYSKSGSAPGQMAGRGEVATGVILAADCQKFINEGFTNLETTYPEEGAGYEVGAVSLIHNARNPEGAKAFIDWTLTAEAQDLAATVGTYSVPTNPEATITDDMVDLDALTLLESDVQKAGSARDELVERFDSEVAPAPKE